MRNILKYGAIAAVALLLVPAFALAQFEQGDPGTGNIPPVDPIGGITGQFSLFGLINTIIAWAFGLLLVLAAVFILWAGFLYLTSGGDEEKTGTAKKYLIYAVVAIVIGALARGIVFIVKGLIGIE